MHRRRWGGRDHARALIRRSGPARFAAGRITSLRRRGQRLFLIDSAGDVGISDGHAQLGRSPRGISRRLGRELLIVPGADHNFSTDGAQERLTEIVPDLVRETGDAAN